MSLVLATTKLLKYNPRCLPTTNQMCIRLKNCKSAKISFENKVAIITGALGGMGQELCRLLLDRKVKVALSDIHEDGGEAVIKLKEKYGKDNLLYIPADVSDESQFKSAFEKTIAAFKNLDIVINNAGIFNEKSPIKTASVNLTGAMKGTALAIETYLPKHKSGDEAIVVNMSSLAGLALFPGAPLYCAAKFGVVALGRCYGHPHHYKTDVSNSFTTKGRIYC